MKTDIEMKKYMYRSNARRKKAFGVHESAIKSMSVHGGESNLRYVSVEARKSIIKDNIECIKLMRTERFRQHLDKMNAEAIKYYKETYENI